MTHADDPSDSPLVVADDQVDAGLLRDRLASGDPQRRVEFVDPGAHGASGGPDVRPVIDAVKLVDDADLVVATVPRSELGVVVRPVTTTAAQVVANLAGTSGAVSWGRAALGPPGTVVDAP